MRREARTPRPDYISKVERLGLLFHTVDDQPYWYEHAAYRFELEEIETLEAATSALQEMCLQAVERVIVQDEYARFGIPEAVRPIIAASWEADPPAIYGRFDLSYDGGGPPKLLEYNADTPTSLLEAAVIQWHWLQEVDPEADQFNSIWEGLTAKWQALKDEGYLESGVVHFASMNAMEDLMTTAVLMDTASEVGLEPRFLYMNQIGWDSASRCFVGTGLERIRTLFKLYPWEWLVRDEFGKHALETYAHVDWIEPIWKMLLSNKALLPLLWEMFPDHPNLLPAYSDGPRDLTRFVKKPTLGREGANVEIWIDGQQICNPGDYGDGAFVWQEYAPLPVFDGSHAVIGSWVIDCEPRGIGVRESDGPITQDLARFVPHYFQNPAAGNAVTYP